MINTSEGKAFVLFSGYNQRGVIAFCRFAENQDIPFYIISSGEDDPLYKTAYSDRIIGNRSSSDLDFESVTETLSQIRDSRGFGELVILPSTEYLNRFLLNNKKEFEAQNITVPLVDESLYESVSDKYSYYSICDDYGLPVPKEINAGNLEFPLVAKPKQYFDGQGKVQSKPLFVDSSGELEEYRKEYNLQNFYFQEYIDGPSYYLLFYISRDGNHARFSQKNYVQQANGGSMLAARPSKLHKKPICDRYIDLFEKLDFHGLVMVELKERDGKYYMIEANPRLWGPSQLFVDAGASIFERFVSELGFSVNVQEKTAAEDVRYFWHGGIMEEFNADRELTYYNGYDRARFLSEFPEWMNHEIYRKSDSNSIFLDEK